MDQIFGKIANPLVRHMLEPMQKLLRKSLAPEQVKVKGLFEFSVSDLHFKPEEVNRLLDNKFPFLVKGMFLANVEMKDNLAFLVIEGPEIVIALNRDYSPDTGIKLAELAKSDLADITQASINASTESLSTLIDRMSRGDSKCSGAVAIRNFLSNLVHRLKVCVKDLCIDLEISDPEDSEVVNVVRMVVEQALISDTSLSLNLPLDATESSLEDMQEQKSISAMGLHFQTFQRGGALESPACVLQVLGDGAGRRGEGDAGDGAEGLEGAGAVIELKLSPNARNGCNLEMGLTVREALLTLGPQQIAILRSVCESIPNDMLRPCGGAARGFERSDRSNLSRGLSLPDKFTRASFLNAGARGGRFAGRYSHSATDTQKSFLDSGSLCEPFSGEEEERYYSLSSSSECEEDYYSPRRGGGFCDGLSFSEVDQDDEDSFYDAEESQSEEEKFEFCQSGRNHSEASSTTFKFQFDVDRMVANVFTSAEAIDLSTRESARADSGRAEHLVLEVKQVHGKVTFFSEERVYFFYAHLLSVHEVYKVDRLEARSRSASRRVGLGGAGSSVDGSESERPAEEARESGEWEEGEGFVMERHHVLTLSYLERDAEGGRGSMLSDSSDGYAGNNSGSDSEEVRAGGFGSGGHGVVVHFSQVESESAAESTARRTKKSFQIYFDEILLTATPSATPYPVAFRLLQSLGDGAFLGWGGADGLGESAPAEECEQLGDPVYFDQWRFQGSYLQVKFRFEREDAYKYSAPVYRPEFAVLIVYSPLYMHNHTGDARVSFPDTIEFSRAEVYLDEGGESGYDYRYIYHECAPESGSLGKPTPFIMNTNESTDVDAVNPQPIFLQWRTRAREMGAEERGWAEEEKVRFLRREGTEPFSSRGYSFEGTFVPKAMDSAEFNQFGERLMASSRFCVGVKIGQVVLTSTKSQYALLLSLIDAAYASTGREEASAAVYDTSDEEVGSTGGSCAGGGGSLGAREGEGGLEAGPRDAMTSFVLDLHLQSVTAFLRQPTSGDSYQDFEFENTEDVHLLSVAGWMGTSRGFLVAEVGSVAVKETSSEGGSSVVVEALNGASNKGAGRPAVVYISACEQRSSAEPCSRTALLELCGVRVSGSCRSRWMEEMVRFFFGSLPEMRVVEMVTDFYVRVQDCAVCVSLGGVPRVAVNVEGAVLSTWFASTREARLNSKTVVKVRAHRARLFASDGVERGGGGARESRGAERWVERGYRALGAVSFVEAEICVQSLALPSVSVSVLDVQAQLETTSDELAVLYLLAVECARRVGGAGEESPRALEGGGSGEQVELELQRRFEEGGYVILVRKSESREEEVRAASDCSVTWFGEARHMPPIVGDYVGRQEEKGEWSADSSVVVLVRASELAWTLRSGTAWGDRGEGASRVGGVCVRVQQFEAKYCHAEGADKFQARIGWLAMLNSVGGGAGGRKSPRVLLEFDRGVRPVGSSMARLAYEVLEGEEGGQSTLAVSVFPLYINLETKCVRFLVRFKSRFWCGVRSVESGLGGVGGARFAWPASGAANRKPISFKRVRISSLDLRVSCSTSVTSFENFNIHLGSLFMMEVPDWNGLVQQVMDAWVPQVWSSLIKSPHSLPGFRYFYSLVNSMTGLVLVPYDQYRRGGSVFGGSLNALMAAGVFITSDILRLSSWFTSFVSSGLGFGESFFRGTAAAPESCAGAAKPKNVIEGLQQAYASFEYQIRDTKKTVMIIPWREYKRKKNLPEFTWLVAKAFPLMILKPAIGITSATSQIIQGQLNSFNSSPFQRKSD